MLLQMLRLISVTLNKTEDKTVAELITSKSNDKIKAAAALVSSAKSRRQTGEFIIEGLRLCIDAARTGIEIRRLFYTRDAYERCAGIEELAGYAAEVYEISTQAAEKLADTQNSQGVFCVCAIPDNTLEVSTVVSGGRYIALENLQNPSNLGAVCRTAEALGINGAILSGCCDAFSPKVQRSAMGSLFRLPMLVTDNLPELLSTLKDSGVKVFATTPDSKAADITTVDFGNSAVSVIGNEANGVTDEIFEICEALTVPMKGRAESLNASMAAALVMWEMLRG